MSVTINLPEKIGHQLKERWGDLPRRTLEADVIGNLGVATLRARQLISGVKCRAAR